MGVLKWIGYVILSTIGLCMAVGIAVLLGVIGASIGTIALGGFIVFLVAVAIAEYFEPPTPPPADRDT